MPRGKSSLSPLFGTVSASRSLRPCLMSLRMGEGCGPIFQSMSFIFEARSPKELSHDRQSRPVRPQTSYVDGTSIRLQHVKTALMADNISSTNPVVQSIVSGNATAAARLVAARGLLPLPQADLLEALVHLSADNDPEIARAA